MSLIQAALNKTAKEQLTKRRVVLATPPPKEPMNEKLEREILEAQKKHLRKSATPVPKEDLKGPKKENGFLLALWTVFIISLGVAAVFYYFSNFGMIDKTTEKQVRVSSEESVITSEQIPTESLLPAVIEKISAGKPEGGKMVVPEVIETAVEVEETVFKLQGITLISGIPSAIIDNQIVEVGELVSEKATVKEIRKDRVHLDFDGKEILLSL